MHSDKEVEKVTISSHSAPFFNLKKLAYKTVEQPKRYDTYVRMNTCYLVV